MKTASEKSQKAKRRRKDTTADEKNSSAKDVRQFLFIDLFVYSLVQSLFLQISRLHWNV